MPQEFHVVRCYACHVFQVQQVKKTPKWTCKMCGEKQSLKKEYGHGSGLDCRRHVQKLNMVAGESLNPGRSLQESTSGHCPNLNPGRSIQDSISGHCSNLTSTSYDDEYQAVSEGTEDFLSETPQADNGLSRWHSYIDSDSIEQTPWSSLQEDDAHPHLDDAEITLSRPAYQGRGWRKCSGWKGGRKRKREVLEQVTVSESWKLPAIHQNRNTSARSFKTSGVHNQENKFPDCQHPADNLPETSSHSEAMNPILTPTGAGLCKFGQKQQMNSKMDDGTSKKDSKEKQLGEVSHCSSSKWGQFLQEDRDDEEEGKQEVETYFQGHETEASITTPNWSTDRLKTVGNLTSQSQFYTSTRTEYQNSESTTSESSATSVQFKETFALKNQDMELVSRSKYREENVKISRTDRKLQGVSEKNVFSLEDEDILNEVLKDDW